MLLYDVYLVPRVSCPRVMLLSWWPDTCHSCQQLTLCHMMLLGCHTELLFCLPIFGNKNVISLYNADKDTNALIQSLNSKLKV